jgi:hypothetical protein
MVTVQVLPEAASQPIHAANTDPESAVAIRVTEDPFGYEAVQDNLQLWCPLEASWLNPMF